MTDPFLTGLPGGPLGATSPPGQELPAWTVVRAEATFVVPGEGVLQRDQLATVDMNDPYWRDQVRFERVTPLPASEQPAIVTDINGNPTLKETLMSMQWITATDANGNDFHALTGDPVTPTVGSEVAAWVYFDKPSGFEIAPGTLELLRLKRLGEPNDGKYGA